MNSIIIDKFPNNKDKKKELAKYIKDNSLSVEFQYKSDFKNTKTLRDFIELAFSFFSVKDIWKSRFVLISDELNNNAIEYGSAPNEVNKFILNITKTKDGINVNLEVIDTGRGSFAKNSKEMYDLQENKLKNGFDNHKGIRGRGLFQIIYKMVDDLYFKDNPSGGLIVGVKKELKNGIDILKK